MHTLRRKQLVRYVAVLARLRASRRREYDRRL
nr:MAG TPA: hypothetical protein [Caudoviricetes sp.]